MALSKREKNLTIAAGVLAVPFVIWLLIGIFGGSTSQLQAQKDKLVEDINAAQKTIRKGREAQKRLDGWNKISLPKDAQAAVSQYKLWLMELSDEYDTKFTQFKPSNPKPIGNIGSLVTVKVSGEASLEQLTRWLYAFYSADYLHQIKGLTINPEDESKRLRVDITVEALALKGAVDAGDKPREEELPQLPEESIDKEILGKYCDTIGGRAIFSRYSPPPPARQPDPPPSRPVEPARPLFDHGKFTEVTGITEIDGRPQVWIRSRTLGKEFRLFEGDSFEVGPVRAKILDIQVRQRTITSEVDGKQYLIALGENLREAKELDAGKE